MKGDSLDLGISPVPCAGKDSEITGEGGRTAETGSVSEGSAGLAEAESCTAAEMLKHNFLILLILQRGK